MGTYYDREHVARYVDMLNPRLANTDYHAVFGTRAEHGSLLAKDEGEGMFLEEYPDAIISYAKGTLEAQAGTGVPSRDRRLGAGTYSRSEVEKYTNGSAFRRDAGQSGEKLHSSDPS